MPSALFYFFSAITLIFGVMVVACRNPVASALSLVVSFAGLAALFISLDAYFIGIIQILVYAGAILVLFLFVIMLLNLADVKPLERIDLVLVHDRKTIWAMLIAGSLLGIGAFVALQSAPSAAAAGGLANTSSAATPITRFLFMGASIHRR